MSCNKLYFDSRKAGKLHVKGLSKQTTRYLNIKSSLTSLRPYKCILCDGWHLTSVTKKASRLLLKRNAQRGLDIDAIKALRGTPTINYLLANQRSWMILHTDDTRSWVTFTEESGFSGRIVLK